MGTSNWQTIPFCIEAIMRINPRRVLDVGVGFGRWGALTREFCELWQERIHPSTWQIEVEGIEAFKDSIQSWHGGFYNKVHLGDARDLLRQLPGPYDLMIFGDVLEHFEKGEARELLDVALAKSKYVLINIPIGKGFEQGERYGNPYEAHLSLWEVEDFRLPVARAGRLFLDAYARDYLSVVLSKEDPRDVAGALGLQLSHGYPADAMEASRKESLDRAAGVVQEVGAMAQRLAASEQRALALSHKVDWLEGNIMQIEASLAWRIIRFCNRVGFFYLPRKALRLWRRLRGKPIAPEVAAMPAPVVPPAAAYVVGASAPVATASAASAASSGADGPEYNIPITGISGDFRKMLETRPESFRKVYLAPALMSPQERVFLYGLAFAFGPKRYLEIGTCHGGSAMLVSAALDDLREGAAYGVDPLRLITEQTASAIGSRFTLVQGPSPQMLPKAWEIAGGPFDMILVDGDHSYQATVNDLEGVFPIAARDAVVLVHDATNEAVSRAIVDFVKAHDGEIRDCGLIVTNCNVIEHEGQLEKWGGVHMLRLNKPEESR